MKKGEGIFQVELFTLLYYFVYHSNQCLLLLIIVTVVEIGRKWGSVGGIGIDYIVI